MSTSVKILPRNDVFTHEIKQNDFIVVCTFRNCIYNPDFNSSPHYSFKYEADHEAVKHMEMEVDYWNEKGE